MNSEHLTSNRRTIVVGSRVVHIRKDDLLYPAVYRERELRTGEKGPDEIWRVMVDVREGAMPIQQSFLHVYCTSKDEAEKKLAEFPIGSELKDYQRTTATEIFGEGEKLHALFDNGWLGVPRSAGDEESPLAFNVLDGAGLTTPSGGLKPDILASLALNRQTALQNLHGENWQTAALFEYAWSNLPHSSAAYLAAAYQYHHYITGDDFAAGYFWRDLEIVANGIETEAIKALEMRENAGKKGKESSIRAKKARISSLMDALEVAAQRNPDALRVLKMRDFLKLALPVAVDDNPTLWRQGKGQAEEYLGQIRRGEAGANLKKRYHALFSEMK